MTNKQTNKQTKRYTEMRSSLMKWFGSVCDSTFLLQCWKCFRPWSRWKRTNKFFRSWILSDKLICYGRRRFNTV